MEEKMKREVTQDEFMKMVEELIPQKPALRLINAQGIPYEKWGNNIKRLVDEALGITRREIMEIEVTPKP